jgi:hypothetical protein
MKIVNKSSSSMQKLLVFDAFCVVTNKLVAGIHHLVQFTQLFIEFAGLVNGIHNIDVACAPA